MTQQDAYIGLNLIKGIGSLSLKKLLEHFSKPQKIFQATRAQLTAVRVLSPESVERIVSFSTRRIAVEMAAARREGIDLVTCADRAYPELLRHIYDPPLVLYVKGSLSCAQESVLAVVGSRKASWYGKKVARQFSAVLAHAGFCIVSGMARGIDTCAHQGALDAQKPTVAVMGSGFRHLYPAENGVLAEEISRCGAVITEYPLDTHVARENFPRRNRIISGLSQGVCVVEAARTSGALITADCALEQGREVFAVPGPIDAVTSDGTNELIRQGAQIVLCPQDIIDTVSFLRIKEEITEQAVKHTDARGAVVQQDVSAEEAAVRALFGEDSVGIDELIEISGMDIPKISGILLNLQVKKIINQLPGKHYQLL